MSNFETNIIERTVEAVLVRLGQANPMVSYNQAVKVYGRWFVELVKLGQIRPIHKGQGKTGTQRYLVSDILAKIDEAKRQAYAEMFNN